MKFDISLSSLEGLQKYISKFCGENEIDGKLKPKACICCDEIASNILNYSGASYGELNLSVENGTLVMVFTDDGKPFNPLSEAKNPDITASVEEREIGGLGIFMVKKMSSGIFYQRKDEKNILTVKF